MANESEKEVQEKAVQNSDKLKTKLLIENKKLWVVAAPAIFTRFSGYGISVISQAFMGKIGSTQLAAYALVFTLLTRFANGLLLGGSSGLETLCGQAYGAKQYHMLGIYLQRSWIVLTSLATLFVPIYIFATPILKGLGQDEAVAEEAKIIALWFIPVIYSYVVSLSCQMFLQTQSKNTIIMYSATFSISIHVFLSWLLTMKFDYGVNGVMLSTVLAYWIPNLGQLMFVTWGGCEDTWHGFSKSAIDDLRPVFKHCLSSGAMICVEFWYEAILILLTGNLRNAEVEIDALSICLNISGWQFMISFGFLAAASVRVSNELGKGNPRAAKFSIVNVVLTSFTIGLALFTFFLIFRGRIAYLFTNDGEVAIRVHLLSPFLAISILMNSIQLVLSGVAVGAGWQRVMVYVTLGCYYLIGIPLGVVLGYVIKLQVEGVWIGMLTGTLIQTIVLIIISKKTNWDKQVCVAQQRLSRWFVDDESNQRTGSV